MKAFTSLRLLLVLLPIFPQAAAVRDSWLGVDKIKHFLVSAFIESVSYSALGVVGVSRGNAQAGAISITAGIGVAREIHDGRVKGLFSARDLVWDGAGIAASTYMLRNTVR